MPLQAALLAALWAASSALCQTAVSTAPISIIYPAQAQSFPPLPGIRVSGSVSTPRAQLRINGQPVRAHPLGGFLAYFPVSPGTNTLRCELELSTGSASLTRSFFVAPPPLPPPPSPPRIAQEGRAPAEDLELRPGDWLHAQMRASSGLKAEFQVVGWRWLPMAELPPRSGLYQGALLVGPDDRAEKAEIRFRLHGSGWSGASASAPGRLTVLRGTPAVGVIRSDGPVTVKAGPNDDGYLLFPSSGTRCVLGGRSGQEVQLLLSPRLSGWVRSNALEVLPPGTPPPRSTLQTLRTIAGPDSTSVYLGMTGVVPFLIEPREEDGLLIRLFHTTADTDWIIYDSSDSFVRELRWRQEDSQTASVELRLAPRERLWGYHASWEAGALRLELRRPPRLAAKGSPLQGRVIVVDPGHMPSLPGAVGPRGVLEKDANLAIAKALESLLQREGARPVLTRSGDDEVGLPERARVAWEKRGDLFISVHNNELPDGENPFASPHGYSVFYYQPFSLELARAVHRAYQRRVPLPDERLRYGNLLVARITEMPAILVESAYMTFPEQEALLTSPPFQRLVAGAMLDGLRSFLEAERTRQAGRAGRP